MTVIELRKEAKRLGLKGYSKLNKAQLWSAIDHHKAEQYEAAKALEQAHNNAAQAVINSNPHDWAITAIVQDEQPQKTQTTPKIAGFSYFGAPINREDYNNARVPAYLKKAKALCESIKNAENLQAVIDLVTPFFGRDSLRQCARLLDIDVSNIYEESRTACDTYKQLIIAKFTEMFSAQENSNVQTTQPEQPQPEQPQEQEQQAQQEQHNENNSPNRWDQLFAEQRRDFIRSLKNGHVSPSVLAELDPEELAKVKQHEQPAVIEQTRKTHTLGYLRATAKLSGIKHYNIMNRQQLEEALQSVRICPSRRKTSFADVSDPKKLRSLLNSTSADIVEDMAFAIRDREINLRTDGVPMKKKDYIGAIVAAYFPNEQQAPKPQPKHSVKAEHVLEETLYTGKKQTSAQHLLSLLSLNATATTLLYSKKTQALLTAEEYR